MIFFLSIVSDAVTRFQSLLEASTVTLHGAITYIPILLFFFFLKIISVNYILFSTNKNN